MKIIFLEINGVLNSEQWNREHQNDINEGRLIDPDMVKLFAGLIEHTGARIVMHSGWRFWFDECLKPLRKEAVYLVEQLKKYNLSIYDMTPDLTTEEIRASKSFSLVKGQEILAWLHQHFEIEEFLILDDIELKGIDIRQHQIVTDAQMGLTKNNVNQGIVLLICENEGVEV